MSRRGFLAEITVEGWVAIVTAVTAALVPLGAGGKWLTARALAWLRQQRLDAMSQLQEIVKDLRARMDELECRYEAKIAKYEEKLAGSEEAHSRCQKENRTLARKVVQLQAENHAQQLQMKDLSDSREAFRREQELLHAQQADLHATIAEMRERLHGTIEDLRQRLQQTGEKA